MLYIHTHYPISIGKKLQLYSNTVVCVSLWSTSICQIASLKACLFDSDKWKLRPAGHGTVGVGQWHFGILTSQVGIKISEFCLINQRIYVSLTTSKWHCCTLYINASTRITDAVILPHNAREYPVRLDCVNRSISYTCKPCTDIHSHSRYCTVLLTFDDRRNISWYIKALACKYVRINYRC